MCACGCLVLAGIVAALVYTVMHGLWLLTVMLVLIAALLGWLTRKMMKERKSM